MKSKPQDNGNQATADNQKTWDTVAHLFTDASALPVWGPFGIGENLNLIPVIKEKTFLEIGCGSGRSIKYLVDHGAKKVYGLDFSSKQIEAATAYNKDSIADGKAILTQGLMESKLTIDPVDYVFSVYAIGWTLEPKATFAHIYSYLKPGGMFIWSWDHSLFTDVQYEDGKFVVAYSYHDENMVTINNWRKEGVSANIIYRKTSSWFELLKEAGFEITGYHEPAPVNLSRGSEDPSKHYSIQKASKVPATFIFVCQKPYSTC